MSPQLTRFSSLDPAQYDERVFNMLHDPQSFNAYAYTRNNPVVLVDPTGEFQWSSFTLGGWQIGRSGIYGTSSVGKGLIAGGAFASIPYTGSAGAYGTLILGGGAIADMESGMLSAANGLNNIVNAFQDEYPETLIEEGVITEVVGSDLLEATQFSSDMGMSIVNLNNGTKILSDRIKTFQASSLNSVTSSNALRDIRNTVAEMLIQGFDSAYQAISGNSTIDSIEEKSFNK